jgi:hypothetical protein
MSWAFMDSYLGVEFEDLSLGENFGAKTLCEELSP